jgi:peptide-methionine (S)-S-oxide reductase
MMMEKAVFAGGCFWCTEAIFQRIHGVISIKPGYTGGTIKNPCYREVCSGRTGHAEAVQIDYDHQLVSFESLLEIFFATHDPTTLNRQGADIGTQYRSGIFYTSAAQKMIAKKFIDQLNKSHFFKAPIVTEITPLDLFYDAEEDHHDYYNQNSEQKYCDYTITPKIEKIKKIFSDKLK